MASSVVFASACSAEAKKPSGPQPQLVSIEHDVAALGPTLPVWTMVDDTLRAGKRSCSLSETAREKNAACLAPLVRGLGSVKRVALAADGNVSMTTLFWAAHSIFENGVKKIDLVGVRKDGARGAVTLTAPEKRDPKAPPPRRPPFISVIVDESGISIASAGATLDGASDGRPGEALFPRRSGPNFDGVQKTLLRIKKSFPQEGTSLIVVAGGNHLRDVVNVMAVSPFPTMRLSPGFTKPTRRPKPPPRSPKNKTKQ